MVENKTETKIVMLTIKEAAALLEDLTEYRVRQMCIRDSYQYRLRDHYPLGYF